MTASAFQAIKGEPDSVPLVGEGSSEFILPEGVAPTPPPPPPPPPPIDPCAKLECCDANIFAYQLPQVKQFQFIAGQGALEPITGQGAEILVPEF